MFKLPENKIRLIWLSGVASSLLLFLLLWSVPRWGIPDSVTDDKEHSELLNANRENVLKVIQTTAGLGFIATAYFAWRNSQLAEDKNVTERFTKAVEMLSSEKLATRLGGIYSLERIAKDSKEDHPVVMEVLTAFVREKASIRPTESQTCIESYLSKENSPEKQESMQQDIQSSLTVIGRRTKQKDEKPLILNSANLTYADLSGADLSSAKLSSAKLTYADLSSAKLTYVDLSDANLTYAKLGGADLSGANLSDVNLSDVNLSDANLSDANLTYANLAIADLSGANLSGANLSDANLSGADLSGANLSDANLSDANLTYANLSDANLSGTNLSGANLSGAGLVNANLSQANLRNIKWNEEAQWLAPAEVAKAINLPEALKQQLRIE